MRVELSFVQGAHFLQTKTKYTKPAPNSVPTTIVQEPQNLETKLLMRVELSFVQGTHFL